MSTNPNYYAVIPANVRYDTTLKANEKLLYGEITALAQSSGICYANNAYFAKLYGVSTRSISTWISNLVERNYIISQVNYVEGTKQVESRYLSILPIQDNFNTSRRKLQKGQEENFERSHEENFQDNNTRLNNTRLINNPIVPFSENENEMSIKQYSGYENCSQDCKRKAKVEINGKLYCRQHQGMFLNEQGNLVAKKENSFGYSFEDFWNLYPKKLGKGKAQEAFKKAIENETFPQTKEQLHNCMIPLYVLHQVGKSQFIPYGASWLNGQRWTDEYDLDSFINEQINHIKDFSLKAAKRQEIINFIHEQAR